MSLIGLGIGTTGCKAIRFSEDGTILVAATREYGIDIPEPEWAEQDADGVWRLAWDCRREVATEAKTTRPWP